MAFKIQSGASTDLWTIDPTSKAGRVTIYDATGRDLSSQSKATYAASGTFTPPATPTDMVRITGSASKVVRLISMKIGTTNTAAGSQTFFLIKRSSNNTTGTFVNATPVPLDSTDAGATATVGHYTANPGGLGAAVGNVNIKRVASSVLVAGSFAGVREESQTEMIDWNSNSNMDKLVTLRGSTQELCINFNGAAIVAGQIHTYLIIWTEE